MWKYPFRTDNILLILILPGDYLIPFIELSHHLGESLLYLLAVDGQFKGPSPGKEMNRLSVYSYLTRYAHEHARSGTLFTEPLPEKS